MATNNILPFCETDTGTNLLTQGAYVAATDRTSGNKPGVASSPLVNKALRQAAFIASQIAQFIADRTDQDVLDNANTATLLANMKLAFSPGLLAPVGAKSASATLSTETVVPCNATSGAIVLTLPAASGLNIGRAYYVVKTDSTANAVTLTRAGSDTIIGANTYPITTQYQSALIVCVATGVWAIFG